MTINAGAVTAIQQAPRPLLLSARGLSKSYGRTPVVSGVDFDLSERAFTTLLGPSGCGKTTILRMIGGFEKPTSGTISLDGLTLDGLPPERRPVNTVFQSYALFPHLSVFDNVAFSLSLRQGAGNIPAKVARALDAVHMGGFADRFPDQLSGGQQQRVAVARAMVAEPRLLLLDEPLSALDRKMRGNLQIELKDLQRRLGIAFVYVTHDQEEAFALSDVVMVMNEGRIVQSGAPQDVYRRPATAFVADFIGGATLISGRVLDTGGGRGTIDTVIGKVEAPILASIVAGDAAVLVLRPESVALAAGQTGIPATVGHVVYTGAGFLVEAVAREVNLRLVVEEPPERGTALRLDIVVAKSFITAEARA